MSLRSIKMALRDFVRSAGAALKYDHTNCEIMPDGRPPARAGDIFVAIHDGPRRTQDSRNSLDELYEVAATLSWRVHDAWDQLGPQVIERITTGFDARCDAFRAILHNNTVPSTGILARMDAHLSAEFPAASSVTGWSEPFYFLGDGPTRLEGPEWFWAKSDRTIVGLVREFRFGDARRVQALGSIL